MILKDMPGYNLVETVHLSGWFPKTLYLSHNMSNHFFGIYLYKLTNTSALLKY